MRRLGGGPEVRRSAARARRSSPALAKYADDLVFPGAWYGATIRSTEPHARLLGIDLDDGFDWSRVVVVTADDIPGENVVSLIDDDQPVLVPVGGEIRHQAEPVALIAAADRVDGAGGAARTCSLRTERLAPVFDPLESEHEFAQYTVERGDAAAAMAQARPGHRGDVSGRAPGAAVHREPGDDRGAAARTAASPSTARCSARTTSTRR